jgi:predicted transcriptional regulator
LQPCVDWYEFTNVSEVCTAYIIRALMEAVQTSETLVNSYQSTQHYNPEDSHLHSNILLKEKLQILKMSYPYGLVSVRG